MVRVLTVPCRSGYSLTDSHPIYILFPNYLNLNQLRLNKVESLRTITKSQTPTGLKTVCFVRESAHTVALASDSLVLRSHKTVVPHWSPYPCDNWRPQCSYLPVGTTLACSNHLIGIVGAFVWSKAADIIKAGNVLEWRPPRGLAIKFQGCRKQQ